MALLRACGAAFLTWLVATVAFNVATVGLLADPQTIQRLDTLGWQILLSHTPTFLVFAVTGAAAALAHPAPARKNRPQHTVAVLTFPIVIVTATMLLQWISPFPLSASGVIAGTLVPLAGAVAGWRLVDLIRRRTELRKRSPVAY